MKINWNKTQPILNVYCLVLVSNFSLHTNLTWVGFIPWQHRAVVSTNLDYLFQSLQKHFYQTQIYTWGPIYES